MEKKLKKKFDNIEKNVYFLVLNNTINFNTYSQKYEYLML